MNASRATPRLHSHINESRENALADENEGREQQLSFFRSSYFYPEPCSKAEYFPASAGFENGA